MRCTTLLCVPGAVLLFGCTNLEVFQLSEDDHAPLVGAMSYYLPRSVITLSGTVTINSCKTEANVTADKNDLTIPDVKDYHVNIQETASLTSVISTEPDPDHHYYISYEKSRSWMKEINFSINTSANGTLQSFNTTINDQAGPTIVAAIGAAVQIGGAASVASVARPAELVAKFEPPNLCSKYLLPDVNTALDKIDKLKKAKQDITLAPAIGPLEVAAQAQAIQGIQSEIDAATKKEKLARSFSFRWVPPDSDDRPTAYGNYWIVDRPIPIATLVYQWFSPGGKDWLDGKQESDVKETKKSDDDLRKNLTSPFHVTLAILKSTTGRSMVRSRNASDGLIVRDPATATLSICRDVKKNCSISTPIQTDNRLVETTEDTNPRMALRIPQFGRVMVLTERSGLFENAVLNATLNPDGTISTIGYHATSTLAAGLASLGTAAGNATTAVAAQNTAIAAGNTAAAAVTTATTAKVQAPDTYNKALADCLAQSATILKAGGTPVPCQ